MRWRSAKRYNQEEKEKRKWGSGTREPHRWLVRAMQKIREGAKKRGGEHKDNWKEKRGDEGQRKKLRKKEAIWVWGCQGRLRN